ncbi:MAG: helix-turn-helix domain-containing protein [Bacteroidota bacterium]
MDNILNLNNPRYLAETMSSVFRRKRLQDNITQAELSRKSGVSLGSLKRFELDAEISLKNLLKLAVALGFADYFHRIREEENDESIEDVMKVKKGNQRKRARSHE